MLHYEKAAGYPDEFGHLLQDMKSVNYWFFNLP